MLWKTLWISIGSCGTIFLPIPSGTKPCGAPCGNILSAWVALWSSLWEYSFRLWDFVLFRLVGRTPTQVLTRSRMRRGPHFRVDWPQPSISVAVAWTRNLQGSVLVSLDFQLDTVRLRLWIGSFNVEMLKMLKCWKIEKDANVEMLKQYLLLLKYF